MRHTIFIIVVLLFALESFNARAFISVSGKVTDMQGKGIANVVVQERDGRHIALSDAVGNFTIEVARGNSVLRFISPGYNLHEMAANGNGPMLVKLTLSLFDDKASSGILKSEERAPAIRGIATSPSPRAMVQFKQRGYRNTSSYRVRIAHEPGSRDAVQDSNKGPIGQDQYDTEDYDAIVENRFLSVRENALSTFSIDVDAASYSNIRRYLQMKQLPPAGSVRIEEMINYFHYAYPVPLSGAPFSINTEMSACPWNSNHRLVLIGLQGKRIETKNLPASNLVFLIDVSGSMQDENKLPLVKASMKLLVEQLREQDRVSLVVYAGNSGLVLPSTSGADKRKILDAIEKLEAGGSTAGGQGIRLAYATARASFLKNANNRVILCTDGDFNVGLSSDAELERLVEEERRSGVFLTVLGYGMGNYKDNKMQKLADKGNGNHAYIDGIGEAKKVLVNEFGGTLFTIAKDVKLQVEFNPAKVQSYRLIGYENRLLNKEDFNDDRKDAGELGSGHTVTALYEVIPQGTVNEFPATVDPLKYQQPVTPAVPFLNSNELMTVKFRYKDPAGDISRMIAHAVADTRMDLQTASANFRFAAAVAEFGMLLRGSEFCQSSSYDNVRKLALGSLGADSEGYRGEFMELLNIAQSLAVK